MQQYGAQTANPPVPAYTLSDRQSGEVSQPPAPVYQDPEPAYQPPAPAYTMPAQRPEQPRAAPSNASPSSSAEAPKSWLIDRITGQSKYNDRERPPGPCCWVPPCVGWCPGLLETNCLCRIFGTCGFSNNEFFRFFCLHIGFVANILAMVGTAYAAMSISLEFFLLSNASMEVLEARDLNGSTEENADIFLGLRGVAFDQPSLYSSPLGRGFVVQYEDLCDIAPSGLYFDASKDCGGCASDYFSTNAVISLMIAVPLFFPTFFAQQLRMYSGYDVNCVKNFLSVIGICIILLNLNVMLTYFFLCSKQSFFEEELVYMDKSGNIVPQEDATYAMEFKWRWGWGLIVLIGATGLKVIDLLCNVSIPTPRVTRDRKEQEIYETIMFVDPDAAPAVEAEESVSEEEDDEEYSEEEVEAESDDGDVEYEYAENLENSGRVMEVSNR